jgi:hypothetical protein
VCSSNPTVSGHLVPRATILARDTWVGSRNGPTTARFDLTGLHSWSVWAYPSEIPEDCEACCSIIEFFRLSVDNAPHEIRSFDPWLSNAYNTINRPAKGRELIHTTDSPQRDNLQLIPGPDYQATIYKEIIPLFTRPLRAYHNNPSKMGLQMWSSQQHVYASGPVMPQHYQSFFCV